MVIYVHTISLRGLRNLRGPSSNLCRQHNRPSARRHFSGSYRRHQNDQEHPDLKKSFRAQLYESTAHRLRRQKEEEHRRSFNYTTTFGKNIAIAFSIVGFTLLGWWFGSNRPYEKLIQSPLPVERAEKPLHNVRKNNMQLAWVDLILILGDEFVSEAPSTRTGHSRSDWSSYQTRDEEIPGIVAYPSTTEEVSAILKMAHMRRIPVIAYSGGTSLEGQFAATRGGICVDFSRMNSILELHKADLDVVVQPGLNWESLNEELGQNNLFFPPDPGPGAMIGGMVGTGCSGTNAYRYGTMKEWVMNLTVVLADGTIIRTRQRPRKSSAGYDLTRFFIGSEGTLGLVTEATLKVAVKPKSESVAVSSFGTIREAAQCVSSVVGEGISIAAVELLDDEQMRCINDSGSTSRRWKEQPTLFFKFNGTANAVKEQIDLVRKIAKTKGSKSFDFARNSGEAAELWSARKEALWSVMAKKRNPSDHVWTTDVAVPISRLPDIIEITKQDLSDSGLLGTIVGHVGDGNFHTILLFSEDERSIAEGVVHRMVKRAVDMEGTTTGEHGVGMIKRDYLPHEVGQGCVDTMRKLKWALDPLCILNPDKVFRSEVAEAGEIKTW